MCVHNLRSMILVIFCFSLLRLCSAIEVSPVIADACDRNAVGKFDFVDDELKICDLTSSSPVSYGFVPVCDSLTYSCANCTMDCYNNGLCVNPRFETTQFCLCQADWGGTFCETRVNDCVQGTVCLSDNLPRITCAPSFPYERGYFFDICNSPEIDCYPTTCGFNCENVSVSLIRAILWGDVCVHDSIQELFVVL